ncbi:23S rRNA (cytidine(2498)-2'-O)-methyltransferase RlmM [Chitinimonas lacunae]|uniref:23S rRNA (Cytidine(2498)-2'-O)-methyltransferase RlmM n=1 Tax=Chitinimonas lacunae TaxID=1963018 RepID=A0ABV8MVX6_9NEIS
MSSQASSRWLFYCRPGFERDCLAELIARHPAARAIEMAEGWGSVRQIPPIELSTLVFPRQLLQWVADVTELPSRDRISPLLTAVEALGQRFSDIWFEYPDTNEGKALSSFCKRFGPLFRERAAHLLDTDPTAPRLHLFFPSLERCLLAIADPASASPWPLGIARVKMPVEAPSRSTLKLAEAFLVLVPEQELTQRLKPGMRAVDLGAAPGGWTYQLVTRGLKVIAVDNGPMKGSMAGHPQVEHQRQDGFRYKPRRPVDWVVCDMVEQPHRVAALMAQWLAEGHANQALFNLKLPMKKRSEAVADAFELIDDKLSAAGIRYTISARQLYHDREEVTVYLRRRR